MSQLGIDIAAVDHDKIDWHKLFAAGYRFTIPRDEYATTTDADYAAFYAAARAAGLVVGWYAFLVHDKSGPDPVEQMRAAAATARRAGYRPGVDLPPSLDVEFPHGGPATGFTGRELLVRILAARSTLVQEFGCAPMLYTANHIWRDDLHDPDVDAAVIESPLWLKRYALGAHEPANPSLILEPEVPRPWGAGNYFFHQLQGDAIDVPGVSGAADLDRFRVMRMGETGARVKQVQKWLGVTENGIAGSETITSLIAFQKHEGLDPDGVLGVATFARLAWR